MIASPEAEARISLPLSPVARGLSATPISWPRVSPRLQHSADLGCHLPSPKFGAQTMFPHPERTNSALHQSPSYLLIPSFVPLYFTFPVSPVSCWKTKASGAAVPKTAVYKYRNAKLREPKVGTAEDAGGVQTPTFDSALDENRSQPTLRGAVIGRPNLRHDDASSLLCQRVHSRTLSFNHEER